MIVNPMYSLLHFPCCWLLLLKPNIYFVANSIYFSEIGSHLIAFGRRLLQSEGTESGGGLFFPCLLLH